MKNTVIIIGLLAAGGLYLYFRRNKKSPVNVISNNQAQATTIPITQEVKNVKEVVVPAKPADPVMRSIIVPQIPTKYADGTTVPKSVLENEEYINAWKKFYENTIFPAGDPRNNVTPSGGMVIGDGKGGFYDPAQV